MAAIVAQTIMRLILAAILGGVIGLEREIAHKPSGLRTNMFICFGSAFFTILSFELANQYPGDHTRIAAQIIPGIGFIGAGSILHSRGSVVGLTSAATLFVVASVGMAVGAGLYLPAVFATLVILLALYTLGRLESKFQGKGSFTSYSVIGESAENVIAELNQILQDENQNMSSVNITRMNNQVRVQFSIEAERSEHQRVLQRLRESTLFRGVEWLGTAERE